MEHADEIISLSYEDPDTYDVADGYKYKALAMLGLGKSLEDVKNVLKYIAYRNKVEDCGGVQI